MYPAGKPFILKRPYWLFDLDGTLTRPLLDFPAIKQSLGLPLDRGILEVLAEMEPRRARSIEAALDRIEWDVAVRAQAAEGAVPLLETLHSRGVLVGIVTRNKREHALETLRSAGLSRFFDEEAVIGREEAKPKPSPAGLLKMLGQWRAVPEEALMIGDFLFDLQAGRAAGTATVYVDSSRDFPFRRWADLTVGRLDELVP